MRHVGADPAVGWTGSSPYCCRNNGAPPNFYRYERDGEEALEVEDELSFFSYEFLDLPLHVYIYPNA
jgi:hypothetical protein